MRNLVVSTIVAAAVVFAACGSADKVTSASDRVQREAPASQTSLTDSWSPSMETIVVGLIRKEPALDGYEPSCVLDQIETEYDTPQDYIDAANNDDPSIESVAVDVLAHC